MLQDRSRSSDPSDCRVLVQRELEIEERRIVISQYCGSMSDPFHEGRITPSGLILRSEKLMSRASQVGATAAELWLRIFSLLLPENAPTLDINFLSATMAA